ncbi:PREDICTED: esterase FE4-like isoform X2 [Trachymyrmex septentrionalis]|nr:PREDICTED: esterase FE4-like isoform X2 [Trachymyrmex septentrionalis]
MLLQLAIPALFIISIKCISIEELKVQVNEGKLIGVVVDGYNVRYLAFRGIPYAKPPVGELRFKDPVPPEPWVGYRDASEYGNKAIQMDLREKITGDEDCLYLNVYTTKIELSKKRPVMVWIHGGAYSTGSGDATMYGPDYIVQKDVILVTLNYRLGVMGFLNLNHEVAAGNQGLKDVVLALKWIQNNILQFGGDPGNVTIFGGSAGGAIVHCLALSPLAKGLFHKVISQSGVISNPWAFNEWTDVGFRLVKKLGKETSDPKVAYKFLKTIDAKTLTRNSQRSIFTETERLSFTMSLFTPTLDTKSPNPFFPEHPREYIRRGIQMPFILGFNRNEGIFLLKGIVFGDINDKDLGKINTNFKKSILSNTLSKLSKIGITVEELRAFYFKGKAISKETLTNYADFLGDEFFVRDIMEVCEMQKSSSGYNSTYLYHFDYNSKTFMKTILNIKVDEGMCHGDDLNFLFYPEIAKMLNLSLPEPDNSNNYKIINYFTQMWTDFAKTGNPTPTTNLWLPISDPKYKGYNYLNIDLNLQMKTFRKEKARWNWENCKNHSNILST